MAKTLVTGGTGLVGSHVVRALVGRGDDVRVALRPSSRMDNLADLNLELEKVDCDVLDRRAVRRALRGVERVFHIAGTTSLRTPGEAVFRVNVQGTRTVLEEALRVGVERAVYTSSVAAVGPAMRGSTADERHPFHGSYGIPYVAAKREAEVEVLRLAARGLPVVIVNPAHVFGPGDLYRSSTVVVRRFLRRQIPAYVDGAINIVDVADVARGHLLADERGIVGERYILGNRNYTWERLFADLGRVSGVEPPAIRLPLPVALALARGAWAVPGTPPITAIEVRAASKWWTYRNTKAKRELGWKPSPHEETVESTVAWYRSREGDSLSREGARQPVGLRVAGFAVRQATGVVGRFAS
jgi:dihydroflavonol-4-reductase